MNAAAARCLRPSLPRCLLVGLVAGGAGSAVVIPTAWLLGTVSGRTYPEELAPSHLAQATVLSALLGAVAFAILARWSRRPVLLFAVLTLGFAAAYSLVVAADPPAPQFAAVVAPLHFLVAIVSIAAFALAGDRLYTTSPPWLRGYGRIVAALLVLFLVAFFAVEALQVPLLTDPSPWLREAGFGAAAVGVALLVVDVFLPVPSSAVMVAHGALFGVVGGALLSLAGGLGATMLGFFVGRRSRALVDRSVGADDRAHAERLLARYGALAIVVTRPVPMLAETTAIVAGTSGLGWGPAALAGAAGNLVPALLYAIAGAVAASLASQTLVFGVVLVVAALFWLAGRGEAGVSPDEAGVSPDTGAGSRRR